MSKRFTKIICVIISVIATLGITLTCGCAGYYGANALAGDYSKGTVEKSDNGGFAVKKGDYVYFINGVENSTAANGYGVPTKGAIYRISSEDLSKHNYSSAEVVVPLVTYTGDYDAGIFIYGDYIYYGTPSTARDSDGNVLNGNLEIKRSKLDGTETMKDYYVQFPALNYQYRVVEVDNTVYILYLATSETLFEESTGVNNLHSYNTVKGEDTLLAYNVSSVMFDGEDKTNPNVYYTMDVKNYASDSNYKYNQVYTVRADATTDKFEGKLSSDTVIGWKDGEDEENKSIYINCGDLVFDGIGHMDEATPFNYNDTDKNLYRYTYTLSAYVNNTLFYTRKTSNNTAYANLFTVEDSQINSSWNPVKNNAADDAYILLDGSSANTFKYIFKDNKFTAVLKTESNGLSINYVNKDGKLNTDIRQVEDSEYFYLFKSGSATILFFDGNYLYYSLSGGNGYTINRIDYTGKCMDYVGMPAEDDVDDYTGIRILDLDATSSWFKPELVNGQLLFASETQTMSAYNYVMACDLRVDGKDDVMNNAQINDYNKKYEGVTEVITNYHDTDKYDAIIYANLENALYYAFYTGETEYIKEIAEVTNAQVEEGGDLVFSEKTLAEYEKFFAPASGNEWSDYTATRKVNNEDIYANRRDYYYAVVGEFSKEDAEAFANTVKGSYFPAYPEDTATWWEHINTAAKVCFIIGMCLIGLLVIGGITVLVIFLVKRKNRKPETTGRRIKVDTTDDKNIDVYSNPDETTAE